MGTESPHNAFNVFFIHIWEILKGHLEIGFGTVAAVVAMDWGWGWGWSRGKCRFDLLGDSGEEVGILNHHDVVMGPKSVWCGSCGKGWGRFKWVGGGGGVGFVAGGGLWPQH